MRTDPAGRKALAVELYERFHAMKTYGKEPESLDSIVSVFARDLADYPAEKVMRAIRAHALTSSEFPTVADIAGLVRRNGRPPLSESQYVAINRKAGEDRTGEEWQFLKDWEAERKGWDEIDPVREQVDRAEMVRLREEVARLREENKRLAEQCRRVGVAKGLERPRPSEEEQVVRTAEAMRQSGAPQADIDEFLACYPAMAVA